jgi:hypothetical protein
MILGFTRQPDTTWHTSLSVEECQKRLEENVQTKWFSLDDLREPFAFLGARLTKPIRGRLRYPAIRLERRRGYNNSFAPIFYGTMEPDPKGGTNIKGHFGMYPGVKLFFVAWFTFFGVLLVGLVSSSISQGRLSSFPYQVITVPALGAGILAIGRLLGKGDEEFLVEFLEKTLEAEGMSKQPESSDLVRWG